MKYINKHKQHKKKHKHKILNLKHKIQYKLQTTVPTVHTYSLTCAFVNGSFRKEWGKKEWYGKGLGN